MTQTDDLVVLGVGKAGLTAANRCVRDGWPVPDKIESGLDGKAITAGHVLSAWTHQGDRGREER